MNKKHRAQFTISHEMLIDMLGLPSGAVIIAVDPNGSDALHGKLSIMVEHESLPPVQEFEMPYNVYPLKKEHQDGRVEFDGWNL